MKNILSLFFEKLKKIPLQYFILIFILAVGIFLRTYEFRDWLLFDPDQARDAQIMEDVLSGRENIPLLGPQSGNTRFSLGPIFYYFGILSGKIFGSFPEAFAFPDLLFSIATIPLFFFFIRRYFGIHIALFLTALISVSSFFLEYSRFAWNINSIPFFVLLFFFGVLGMMDEERNTEKKWILCAGVGLGVSIQLHTVLLIVLPLLSFLSLVYLWKKHLISIGSFLSLLLLVLFINTGQIVSEMRTDGANIRAFLGGVSDQSEPSSTLVRNVLYITSCQMKHTVHTVSSLFPEERCGRGSTRDIFNGTGISFPKALTIILFSVGGFFLLIRKWFREVDEKRKRFLVLMLVYNILLFVTLVPVASEITMRYFIMLSFLPLVLLGLWMEHIEKKWIYGKSIVIVLGCFLIFLNLRTDFQTAFSLQEQKANNEVHSFFGETEHIAEYLISLANGRKHLYFTGNNEYEKRYHRSLQYMLRKEGIALPEIRKKTRIASGEMILYITGTNKKQLTVGDEVDDAVVISRKQFNQIILYVLEEL